MDCHGSGIWLPIRWNDLVKKPRTLFTRIVFSFALTLVVLLGILAGALLLGYQRSNVAWTESRIGYVRDYARTYFSQVSPPTGEPGQPYFLEDANGEVPIFLYDLQKNLVATNRDVGTRRLNYHENLVEVWNQGELVGYFGAGMIQFRNDGSNEVFVTVLFRALFAGALSALILGLGAAVVLSRSLVRPANLVSEGIDLFAQGKLTHRIPEEGTTEILAIARSANIMAARLSRERELRAQWAQDITHDLRTPLASVKARIEAFADGVVAPNPARLSSILEELTRIEDLVTDLEELTRLETPEIALDLQQISLLSLAGSLRERFSAEAQTRGLGLAFQDSGDVVVQADESLLYRALSNLISNALRYSHDHTTIEVRWKAEGQAARIEVKNHGPVLSPQEQEKVFSRLYRGDFARTTRGTGLGLTITQQIAHLHQGSVTVRSSVEEGTVFTLSVLYINSPIPYIVG